MLCALTVRTRKPGTFEQFREAFMRSEAAGDPREGWVRFNMLRDADSWMSERRVVLLGTRSRRSGAWRGSSGTAR